jgi:hypothetical protein
MVRVGTPAAKVDGFTQCDPNSDGTLTWRYWAIHTSDPARPRMYGWIPASCPRRLRHMSQLPRHTDPPRFATAASR